jgi:nitric oxide reductase activation protein
VRHTEGDDLELDAMVKAQIAVRSGHDPDAAMFQRARKQKPDLSVLVLMDLSVSTSRLTTDGTSMLELMRRASLLLGCAIEHSRDQWAIHGFRSNGRHQVHYLRLKEFNQPLDDQVLQRMAALKSEWSTRMGAAIRHASRLMRRAKTQQRLILLLTDGEPHDIDMPWPTTLTKDAARAVAQSTAEGTPIFCVSVDRTGDNYLKEIFGSHRYRVIDHLEQLPSKLPELYCQLSA